MARTVDFLVSGTDWGSSIAGKGWEIVFFHFFLADGPGGECFIGPKGVADVDHLKMILYSSVCFLFSGNNCFIEEHDGLGC